jgi:hypothetical protein
MKDRQYNDQTKAESEALIDEGQTIKLLILPLFGHYIVCPSSIKASDSAFVWSLYCLSFID